VQKIECQLVAEANSPLTTQPFVTLEQCA